MDVKEIAKPGEPAPLRRGLFGLRKVLSRYRRWYDEQVAMNRRRIEEDARRFGGSVRWDL